MWSEVEGALFGGQAMISGVGGVDPLIERCSCAVLVLFVGVEFGCVDLSEWCVL